jgi:phosphoribosylformylglycinamidine synthase I
MQLKALVLSGYGINCEAESKYCVEAVGGAADIVHINTLIEKPGLLEGYSMLFIPGGFSFGDDLGSGRVFANKMKFRLSDTLLDFVNDGKLVLGVCNGFQVMVKMGILPEPDFKQRVTLTANDSGHFEDRWVALRANENSPCVFTKGLKTILLPVRHGEGKFVAQDEQALKTLAEQNRIVFQYVDDRGKLGGYPYNPNGSQLNIAGICDSTGRIFGMMPHPEAFNIIQNCPYWTTGLIKEAQGLRIFKNASDYLKDK